MRLKRRNLILLSIIIIVASFGIYYPITFEINSHTFPIYIKGIHHLKQGYAFSDGSKENPTIYVPTGSVISFYISNDDNSIDSMDFNIDVFNVHSKPITYSQTQKIDFLADKEGTFTYYSKLHPDMNGTIIVESQKIPTFIKPP